MNEGIYDNYDWLSTNRYFSNCISGCNSQSDQLYEATSPENEILAESLTDFTETHGEGSFSTVDLGSHLEWEVFEGT